MSSIATKEEDSSSSCEEVKKNKLFSVFFLVNSPVLKEIRSRDDAGVEDIETEELMKSLLRIMETMYSKHIGTSKDIHDFSNIC